MHLIRICNAGGHRHVPTPSDRAKYQQCLLDLVKGFGHILEWLDDRLSMNPRFFVGNVSYQATLLQQRNAELMSVAFVNLVFGEAYASMVQQSRAAMAKVVCPDLPNLYLIIDASQVMNLKTVPKDYLAAVNPVTQDPLRQLINSVAAYNGKNALTVVARGSIPIQISNPYFRPVHDLSESGEPTC